MPSKDSKQVWWTVIGRQPLADGDSGRDWQTDTGRMGQADGLAVEVADGHLPQRVIFTKSDVRGKHRTSDIWTTLSSTIDKINIMYSTVVSSYLKYCGCLQPLLITINFHLSLSFIFHPMVLYWRGSIYPKSWHCCKVPKHLHLPSTVHLR
jgi:hypothetical protein